MYLTEEEKKIQLEILEQQSHQAQNLVLRVLMKMCEPSSNNFWQRTPMATTNVEPLPDNLEKFVNEHRDEFQKWLKQEVSQHDL